ncbi:MAG: hypothetical protein Q4C25_07345, partial [Bacillota bacterium]|nr:hypothetical protein [Bacillota bacterium]
MIKNFIRSAENKLTDKTILRDMGLGKRTMLGMLADSGWKENMRRLAEEEQFGATELLSALKGVMDKLAPEPEEGWLQFVYDDIRACMYPESFARSGSREQQKAKIFLLENYRALLEYEKNKFGFSPVDHIELLDREEVEDCLTCSEYERLREFWRENYIFEFMRIGREITPYNTAGHIGGVHFVATFIGRQLLGTDVPMDFALVSGAAAGHDLGKYGCRPQEEKRIPYLHYYYTYELLKREGMPMMAHIAGNHSTWDLELENLSIESLILIYADFRVKSKREGGNEKVCFYTLTDAFDVILSKLDNVDEAKRQRYERVYDKLKDFENYLIDLGVETELTAPPAHISRGGRKNTALLTGSQVVETLKYTAIEHNIKLMSIFNNESAFGSLLEAARSEKQWKSQRAYLNILSEYFTYMTKQEKLLTIHFLYELLSHREGDIRRQAGRLMGTIIANYDDVYRKELPDFVDGQNNGQESQCGDIWQTYLNKIVFPDYRVTDQHRSWIGYTLKVVIQGILESTDEEKAALFLERYFKLFQKKKLRDSAVFVLLDSVIALPEKVFGEKELLSVLIFAVQVSVREPVEIKIGAIRAAEFITRRFSGAATASYVKEILRNCSDALQNVSVASLARKVLLNVGETRLAERYEEQISRETSSSAKEDAISYIFRENLKVDTPWVVKAVNIDFLLELTLASGRKDQCFHLATHFSNLIKVSERVTVRHRAGRGLIEIADKLPIDQINEIVIELTKGLEIGEYQFSKYIPEYLGELALYLYPSELDEFISNLGELMQSNNDRVGSVALDALGEVLGNYAGYKKRFGEDTQVYKARKERMLGMLLKGLANYREVVSQEAFMVIGQYLFGSDRLSLKEKFDVFRQIYKKMLTLISSIEEYDMNFFTNAAALNHIYRFISEYKFGCGQMQLPVNRKIAFFPGTFDPFSLSHKGIVQAIRDEGFEVYLALDEFSWSKKTQARMIRRQIITMSVADEADVFLFPDDVPVNIANPQDLKRLKSLFPGKTLYMVAGSDVIVNASSYKAKPVKNSIHSINHIVFRRQTMEAEYKDDSQLRKAYEQISGKIRELKLPVY